MRKYLLLAGFVATLSMNNAQAQGYYVEDDGYYYEQPRYMRQVNYQQPRYENARYVRESSPRYRRVSSADAVRYREPTYTQTAHYNEPQVNRIRPYIGLDVAAQKLKYDNGDVKNIYKDKTTSLSGVIGAQINKNFGIEAYYQQSSEEDKTTKIKVNNPSGELEGYLNEKGTISYKSYGLDFIGYMPLSQEFELLAALGVGQYDFESKFSVTYEAAPGSHISVDPQQHKSDKDSLGIRVGIGAQYDVTNHIALRAMARYVKMTKDDYIKSLTELSLGIRYLF